MTDATTEPVHLVTALTKAEVDLDAATQIARTGRETDIAKALPDIKRAKANLESALQAFVAAAHAGKFVHVGPLDGARDTETRYERSTKTTTPASIKGKGR